MLSQFSYPIICAKKYAQTVNFYEDYFEFSPEFELPDFSIMKRKNWKDSYIAIIGQNHDGIPESYRQATQGLILNFPVQDVDAFYQQLYWEGLDIISEPKVAPCAHKHFFVKDPNGNLINITQNMQLKASGADQRGEFFRDSITA